MLPTDEDRLGIADFLDRDDVAGAGTGFAAGGALGAAGWDAAPSPNAGSDRTNDTTSDRATMGHDLRFFMTTPLACLDTARGPGLCG